MPVATSCSPDAPSCGVSRPFTVFKLAQMNLNGNYGNGVEPLSNLQVEGGVLGQFALSH
jgi:hypothetical protein